jgi:L-rhamnose mutarotase
MKRYCFTLDLRDEPELIAAYEKHHRAVWPEIVASIKEAGIRNMEIFRWGNRLFMIMEVDEATFSFERKAALDAANPKVQEWEELMWKYQQALPGVAAGEKWQLMDKIFAL